MTAPFVNILLSQGQTLFDWLIKHQYIDATKIEIFKNQPDLTIIKLYTNDHSYQIIAKPHYLGCQGGTRKPRPGETWHRGNDLPDGPFCRAKFDRIMGAIVGYELKQIAVHVESKVKPPVSLPVGDNA